MPQNAMIIVFIVFELLTDIQKGLKLPSSHPTNQIRVKVGIFQ